MVFWIFFGYFNVFWGILGIFGYSVEAADNLGQQGQKRPAGRCGWRRGRWRPSSWPSLSSHCPRPWPGNGSPAGASSGPRSSPLVPAPSGHRTPSRPAPMLGEPAKRALTVQRSAVRPGLGSRAPPWSLRRCRRPTRMTTGLSRPRPLPPPRCRGPRSLRSHSPSGGHPCFPHPLLLRSRPGTQPPLRPSRTTRTGSDPGHQASASSQPRLEHVELEQK